MTQIALTLWIAILNLQLQASQIPNLSPEVQTQVKMVSDLGLGYVHQILNNPVAETKQIVDIPQTTVTPMVHTVVTEAPTIVPLQFITIPTITLVSTSTDSVQIIHKRNFHFETNVPVTAEFYIGSSKRDIGSNASTTFRFDYTGNFDNYSIVIKSQDGQVKTFRDRCDGSPTCFNPGRTGPREYRIE